LQVELFDKILQVFRNSIPMDKHKYSGSPVGIPTPVVDVQ